MKFDTPYARGVVHRHPAGFDESHILVKGVSVGDAVQYIAADPPAGRYSKYGSYQAFPSPEVAISGRNTGVVEVKNGTFSFVIPVPNSYYANGGVVLLPPQVVLRVWDRDRWMGDAVVTLDTLIPFKGLTYAPTRTGPEFYAGNEGLPPRSQQKILEDSAWCGEMSVKRYAEDFWGSVPRP